MNNQKLISWGLSEKAATEAALYQNLYAGRCCSQAKGLYRVVTEEGELLAEVSGKLRFQAKTASSYPAVGDFVMLDRDTNETGNAIIHHILQRKSVFIRKAAGTANDEQVVASNIDTVFICMALNNDFNLRRLERYLSIAWDSGALPVVVFTKSDLCGDLTQKLLQAESVCVGVEILATSAMHEDGYTKVLQYIKARRTVAFIGSSGVGKSTLINRLMGEEKLDTQGLRNDDKGRHTTTSRELILLPNGGMVIDTPGMRELGIESADLSKSFADIARLAESCKFADCSHKTEPGCAVRQAIFTGELTEDRLESFYKLKREAKYEGLNSRQIENAKIEEMFSGLGGMKNARKYLKDKNKNRNG